MEKSNENQPHNRKRKSDEMTGAEPQHAMTAAERKAKQREKLKAAPPAVQAAQKEKEKRWKKNWEANSAAKGKSIIRKRSQVTIRKDDNRLQGLKKIHKASMAIAVDVTTKTLDAVNSGAPKSEEEVSESERVDVITDIHQEGVTATGLLTNNAVDAVNGKEITSQNNSLSDDTPELVQDDNPELEDGEIDELDQRDEDGTLAIAIKPDNGNTKSSMATLSTSKIITTAGGICILTSDPYQATSRTTAYLEKQFTAKASGYPDVLQAIYKANGAWEKFLAVKRMYPPEEGNKIEAFLQKLLFPKNQLHHNFDVNDVVDSRHPRNQPNGGGIKNVEEWVAVWNDCVKLVAPESDISLVLCKDDEELPAPLLRCRMKALR